MKKAILLIILTGLPVVCHAESDPGSTNGNDKNSTNADSGNTSSGQMVVVPA